MGLAFEKPKRGSYKRARRLRRIEKSTNKKAIRAKLFPEDIVVLCVCCRRRRAESMHEMKPESTGGIASELNSVPVCGSGTTGCHGHLQRHNIYGERINGQWVFTPKRDVARRWMVGE